ncbi:hypothetical protein QR680_014734 [Steinernema hermaphroditum]|uniref:Uncharacterized protein n=1 Tax=Steinernema hermaphroditum TaxID=289476 RepID=A0AA39I9Y7_9BILA|nr:hypothetical protein QR680_014734 [Steinernema hermaphroditum]
MSCSIAMFAAFYGELGVAALLIVALVIILFVERAVVKWVLGGRKQQPYKPLPTEPAPGVSDKDTMNVNDRQAELLRKRQLLAQIRAEKKASDEARQATPPPPEVPSLDGTLDVDDLISSIEPSESSTTVAESLEVSTLSEMVTAVEAPLAPAPQVETLEISTQTKEIVAYPRETQTDFTSSDSEESRRDDSESADENTVRPRRYQVKISFQSEEDDLFELRMKAGQPKPKSQGEEEKGGSAEQHAEQGQKANEQLSDEEELEDPFREGELKLALERELFDRKWAIGRMVMDMCYAKARPELIAVSYAVAPLTRCPEHPGVVEVWNINKRGGKPERTLFSPSPILTVQFGPDTTNFIVGGCYNGQIVIWDLRKTTQSNPDRNSSVSQKTHAAPVKCLKVISTRSMGMAVSLDSQSRVCMWNLENLGEPFYWSVVSKSERFADLHVTVLAQMTNNYMVGCGDGKVGSVGFATEEDTIIKTIMEHKSEVTAIDIHPAPPYASGGDGTCNLFLTASLDYTVRLSDMKRKRTLAVFEGHNDYVLDVKWHPTKPSIFASLDVNGWVYLWDITRNWDSPMYEMHLLNTAKRIMWSFDGKQLFTGDGSGRVRIYNVHESIWKTKSADWMNVAETAELLAHRSINNAPSEVPLEDNILGVPSAVLRHLLILLFRSRSFGRNSSLVVFMSKQNPSSQGNMTKEKSKAPAAEQSKSRNTEDTHDVDSEALDVEKFLENVANLESQTRLAITEESDEAAANGNEEKILTCNRSMRTDENDSVDEEAKGEQDRK